MPFRLTAVSQSVPCQASTGAARTACPIERFQGYFTELPLWRDMCALHKLASGRLVIACSIPWAAITFLWPSLAAHQEYAAMHDICGLSGQHRSSMVDVLPSGLISDGTPAHAWLHGQVSGPITGLIKPITRVRPWVSRSFVDMIGPCYGHTNGPFQSPILSKACHGLRSQILQGNANVLKRVCVTILHRVSIDETTKLGAMTSEFQLHVSVFRIILILACSCVLSMFCLQLRLRKGRQPC